MLLKKAPNEKDAPAILKWASKDGEFRRQTSVFRNWISSEPGAEFPAEKDRYHLYVSYACPWGELEGSNGIGLPEEE